MDAKVSKTLPGVAGELPEGWRVVYLAKGAGFPPMEHPERCVYLFVGPTLADKVAGQIIAQKGVTVFEGLDDFVSDNMVRDFHAIGHIFPRQLADLVNMERSVSALGPAIAALEVETSPPLASAIQATENLWTTIERRWGLLGSTDVAKLLGAKTSNRSLASSLRKKGQLIGVERTNAFLYPGFQFDRTAGAVHAAIPELIKAARANEIDDEDLVFWLCTPSRYFDDGLPVDHLLDDPSIVQKLVDSETISW
ncbi:hypothetical protein [Arthrobacter wenxiniae]|uniref:Antitoxin Xre/MbcA/ParS-like toxin-binding domain-containing protein n=1 Tax=Arthrobacter wenxiniae TaxID=2713570 RepID=A0A7Y7LZL5_9MICC|nr:hypothetical protein [Arthrobacter wenxiniae]NVM96112.1 hypothetical protein [Arthrobacter wenxiniae]